MKVSISSGKNRLALIVMVAIVALAVAGVAAIFAVGEANKPQGQKPAAVSAQDLQFGQAVYTRNLQAINMATVASQPGHAPTLISLAKSWNSTLSAKNVQIKSWLKRNHFFIKPGMSLPTRLNLQPTEFRWALAAGNGSDFRLATAMRESALQFDLVEAQKVVSDGELRQIIIEIQQINKQSIKTLTELRRVK